MLKPIPGYDGYSACDDGRIFSHKMGKFITPYMHKKGGMRMYVRTGSQRTSVSVHSLMLLAFVGPAPEGAIARHLNGNREDNRRENLVWGFHGGVEIDKRIKALEEGIPNVEYLREVLHYNPETGEMTWIKRRFGRLVGRQQKSAGGLHKDTRYGQISIGNKRYSIHRIAWLMTHGTMPDGVIDHINGDPSDNRMSNLRVVTPDENMRNRRLGSNNKSGVIGVRWVESMKKWAAQIGFKRKTYFLGHHDTKEQAVAVRREAEKSFGFHENHGRHPSPERSE